MKKPIALVLSALMLASCGGNVIDTPLEKTEGEAKADSLYEGLETALGNKCMNVETTLGIEDFSETSSDVTVTAISSGSLLYRIDTVDDVAYMKEETTIKITSSGGSENGVMEMGGTLETWYFDGNEATKSDATANIFGSTVHEVEYSIDDFEGTAKDMALALFDELIEYLYVVEWGSVSYYGNSNEGDLRVVATNGMMGIVPIDSFELTYESGLPTKVVTVQKADATGAGYETSVTTTSIITYPSSMDISTPDLTSEEWSNANA